MNGEVDNEETLRCERCPNVIEEDEEGTISCNQCRRCLKLCCPNCANNVLTQGKDRELCYCIKCLPFVGAEGKKATTELLMREWEKLLEECLTDENLRRKVLNDRIYLVDPITSIQERTSVSSYIEFLDVLIGKKIDFIILHKGGKREVAKSLRENRSKWEKKLAF